MASLAGLPRPDHVHGNDLSPLLADPALDWQEPVLSTNGENNHALRTMRFRYIRYADGEREAYDLQADPFERVNLAAEASKAPLLGELDAQLEVLLNRTPRDYRQ